MAKKVKTVLKLQLPAGGANPAPPVGTALGLRASTSRSSASSSMRHKGYEGRCRSCRNHDLRGSHVQLHPEDPSASALLKAAAASRRVPRTAHGQSWQGHESAGRAIAERKLPDLNTDNLEAAEKIIMGTAKNMGLR